MIGRFVPGVMSLALSPVRGASSVGSGGSTFVACTGLPMPRSRRLLTAAMTVVWRDVLATHQLGELEQSFFREPARERHEFMHLLWSAARVAALTLLEGFAQARAALACLFFC